MWGYEKNGLKKGRGILVICLGLLLGYDAGDSFLVDSIERWLSCFSGVPCSRDSDRAAQVCHQTVNEIIVWPRGKVLSHSIFTFKTKSSIFQSLVSWTREKKIIEKKLCESYEKQTVRKTKETETESENYNWRLKLIWYFVRFFKFQWRYQVLGSDGWRGWVSFFSFIFFLQMLPQECNGISSFSKFSTRRTFQSNNYLDRIQFEDDLEPQAILSIFGIF